MCNVLLSRIPFNFGRFFYFRMFSFDGIPGFFFVPLPIIFTRNYQIVSCFVRSSELYRRKRRKKHSIECCSSYWLEKRKTTVLSNVHEPIISKSTHQSTDSIVVYLFMYPCICSPNQFRRQWHLFICEFVTDRNRKNEDRWPRDFWYAKVTSEWCTECNL